MSKFKIGDKIVRIEPSNSLVVGEVYTVKACYSYGGVGVEGYAGQYESRFFELAEDTSKHHKHHDWIVIQNPTWLANYKYRIKPINPEAEKLNKLISDMEQQLTDAKKRLKEVASV